MSAPFVPADQAEREEIFARVGENMCVEAGAGTGKTSLLVDRIVRILASGHAQVHQLAVITFTEKAASELAARTRLGLEGARDETGDEMARQRLEDAISGLNRARIETIHAFAAGLLRERPVEAGLDPGFEVLDELPSQLAFAEAYDEWLTAQTDEARPQDLLDALNLGLPATCLREGADVLHRNRDLLPLPRYTSLPADVDSFLDDFAPAARQLDRLRSCVLSDSDGAYKELLRTLELYRTFDALRAEPRALRRAIVTARAPRSHAGSKTHWLPQQRCGEVKAVLRESAGAMSALSASMKQDATAGLLTWLQRFVDHYAQTRKREGKAEFLDLLLWARDLVRDDPGVRRYFQEKFRCIIVDEFQDTDPLQVELIIYLCEDGQEATDWRNARLRPGSLFIVGDPKQSIYRFRRADIAMYEQVKARAFSDAPRHIVQNFRSTAAIIAWTNRVFERLITVDPGMQPAYVPLAHRPDLAAVDGVTFVRGDVPPPAGANAPAAGDLRRTEAAAIASLIKRAVDNGEWTLRDGRPATFRDVTILIPSRAELYIYEDAFALAGVPARHEGGRSFFGRQEVRELVAILRAIDDPADAVAAVAALRSPAFGCSDEDLLLYRTGGRSLDYLRADLGGGGIVETSLRTLRDFAANRRGEQLPALVRRVIDETRLVEFAMLQPNGEQGGANLLKVIDQARAFAATGGGLRGFIRWLKENIALASDESDAPLSEETDDVVRILTVHAAKGLEFPVVVFANMNTERADRTKAIADREHATLHVRLGKAEGKFITPGFDVAEARESQYAAAEEKRLLYVAATRAQDRLIVPMFAPAGDDPATRDWDKKPVKCLNDWLRQVGAEGDVTIDAATLPRNDGDPPIWRRPPEDAPPADVARVTAHRDGWRDAQRTLHETAGAPLRVVTASALKDEDGTGSPSTEEVVRRARGRDFGVAVHALLERVDLRRPDDRAPLAAAVAAEFGLAGREREIERVARNALAGDAVSRALRSRRVLRETPFSVALPSASNGAVTGLAEGRIDLLFEENGEIVVVDFKTDAVSKNDVDARAAEYRGQAMVYAWAAARATGMPVRELIFVFARLPAEHRVSVDEAFLRGAEALVRVSAPT